MLDSQFWPTVATVLPVLALAIVVEARGSISRWTDHYPPRWLRTMQGILWVIPIVLFVYLEPIAFQALEGTKPSHFTVSLVGPTVGASLSVLVINPGFELLIRSNARLTVELSLFMVTIPLRLSVRKNLAQTRRNARRAKEAKRTALIASVELYSLEAEVNSWSDTEKKREALAKIAQARMKLVAHRKDIDDLENDIEDTLSKGIKIRKKIKTDTASPEEIARLENAVIQMDFRINDAKNISQEEFKDDLRN